jgi:hypothetical protein
MQRIPECDAHPNGDLRTQRLSGPHDRPRPVGYIPPGHPEEDTLLGIRRTPDGDPMLGRRPLAHHEIPMRISIHQLAQMCDALFNNRDPRRSCNYTRHQHPLHGQRREANYQHPTVLQVRPQRLRLQR